MDSERSYAEIRAGHDVPVDVRYRMLIEQIPAVTYICEFSPSAPFLYMSPQVEEMLGHPAARWVAEPELWAASLHPDDRERVLSGEVESFDLAEDYEGEFRMIAADGRVVWVWERDTVIRDEVGRPVCTQGILMDITRLKHTERELTESQERAQRYLDVAATIIVVVVADGTVSLVNRRACEVLGYAEGELTGRDWFELVVPEPERAAGRDAFAALIDGGLERGDEFETHVVSKSGERRLIAWRNSLLRDERGRVTAMLSSGEDITEQRRAQERVAFLAYHDPLTGLANRSLLTERLASAVAKAAGAGTGVGLLCVDLDDFKLVNDSLGHAVGDELLTGVAARLRAGGRHQDVLARAGGDEFLLLLPDLPADGERHAEIAAARATALLAEPFQVAGVSLHVSASVGISLFPRDAGDADELLRHADAAMYQAKRAGRAGHRLYEPEADNPLERLSLTARLRQSLDRHEFELHYQPIFALAGAMRPVGVEALLRWRDPVQGLVPPAVFIPAAENSGLIEPIGAWVVDELCRQGAEWQSLGLTPRLSVNASPRELRRPEYPDTLAGALRRHRIDPARVVVEVTESSAMDKSAGPGLLDRVHALGVGLAIDDFGEGFSSLSRLRDMPVEQLKIDRSFMREVPANEEASAVVAAIIQLADALGREVVAEGVETDEQREFLAAHGCPLAQGFHLSRPLPAEEVTALLLRS
ncbi:MAG TPA: EAL domain-containing protein [Thermoleophilaceae bacterium]|nr:EAL domain-containing protein [Thermoleophilaceae bacterium]